jgi:hypothetical protein
MLNGNTVCCTDRTRDSLEYSLLLQKCNLTGILQMAISEAMLHLRASRLHAENSSGRLSKDWREFVHSISSAKRGPSSTIRYWFITSRPRSTNGSAE